MLQVANIMDFGVVLWKEDKKPQAEELKHWLETEGFSVKVWEDPPGTTYQPHSHGHDESIWVLTGEIKFIVADQSYPLKPGDRLFLPRNTLHAAKVPAGGAVHYLIGQK